MISIKRKCGYHFDLHFDKPDITAIRKLADAYGIPSDDMIVGCINKGIEVIGKQVKDNETDNRYDGDGEG